jgi:hypothetical protein
MNNSTHLILMVHLGLRFHKNNVFLKDIATLGFDIMI